MKPFPFPLPPNPSNRCPSKFKSLHGFQLLSGLYTSSCRDSPMGRRSLSPISSISTLLIPVTRAPLTCFYPSSEKHLAIQGLPVQTQELTIALALALTRSCLSLPSRGPEKTSHRISFEDEDSCTVSRQKNTYPRCRVHRSTPAHDIFHWPRYKIGHARRSPRRRPR